MRKPENDKSYFSLVKELGFALMLVGVQFGTALRNVFPSLELVNILMFLSFIFSLNINNIRQFKLPSWNNYFLLVITFVVISLFYSIMFPCPLKFKYLSDKIFFMQLYILGIIFSLSSQSRNMNFVYFQRIIFYLSGFICIVILYQVTKGFSGISLDNAFYNPDTDTNSMKEGGDKITMGRALFLCFAATIVLPTKNLFEKLLKPFLIVSIFLNLYMFNSRASIAICIISVLIYFWKTKNKNNKKSRKISKVTYITLSLFTLIMLIYLYNSNSIFNTAINLGVYNLKSGFSSYFMGNNSVTFDSSAAYRFQSRLLFWQNLTNSNFLQFIFGHGFLPYYYDFPLIQVFNDLGLLGFILYFIILIYTPIKFIFFKSTTISHIIIVQLFAFHYVLDQFYCGLPYWSMQYMPILLLVFFYKNKKDHFIKNL